MSTSVALAFAGGAAVGALAMRVRQSHEFGKFIRDKVVSLERNDRGERVIRIEKAPEDDDRMMDKPATTERKFMGQFCKAVADRPNEETEERE